jgi:hypothetical protein
LEPAVEATQLVEQAWRELYFHEPSSSGHSKDARTTVRHSKRVCGKQACPPDVEAQLDHTTRRAKNVSLPRRADDDAPSLWSKNGQMKCLMSLPRTPKKTRWKWISTPKPTGSSDELLAVYDPSNDAHR